MYKNVKAIFVDSEGTIRDENRFVKPEIIETLDELKRNDIYVILTTGLPRFIVRNIRIKTHTSNLIICSNGADIYDVDTEKEISSSFIDPKILYELYKRYHDTFTFILGQGDTEYASDVSEYNSNPNWINEDNIFGNYYQCHISQKPLAPCDNVQGELRILRNNKDADLENIVGQKMAHSLFHSENLTKSEIEILIRLKRFFELQRIQNEILHDYSGTISLANQSADFAKFQFSGEIPWFSLNDISVSKGTGIEKLCNYLGISKEETMAIGNDYNDRTMIDVAGLFGCPSNSCEVILERSGFVYDANAGIDKVFRKVLQENGQNNR